MNTLYFKLYDFFVEVKSSDTPLKHLKINSELAFFSVMKPEPSHLVVHISALPVLFREGFFIGRTKMCEVRQVGFSKRQLIYEKVGRTLAIVKDNAIEDPREIELLAHNQEIIDEILFKLIIACARESLESRESSHSFPLLPQLKITEMWEFLVRPNNISTVYRIIKNRRKLAKKPKA
jgi:hypothetical protein